MKAFFITMLLLVSGDFLLNHGNATHQTYASVRGFASWLSQAGEQSLFTS